MSGSSVSASINTFSAGNATAVPEKLHHLGRCFGFLASVEPAEECQLALMTGHYGERLLVLPQDLDLSGYTGQKVGMMCYEGKILIRRLA